VLKPHIKEPAMSQAVVDFCENLKTALLGLEERLDQAKTSMETGAAGAQAEAKKHLDEASAQLEAFKVHAGLMAQALRAEMPEMSAGAKQKLGEFGQEAQVAMRHAVVFLAEAAASGMTIGAHQAKAMAEKLRRETAVAKTEPDAGRPGENGGGASA
jgi:hypothetical protein